MSYWDITFILCFTLAYYVYWEAQDRDLKLWECWSSIAAILYCGWWFIYHAVKIFTLIINLWGIL